MNADQFGKIPRFIRCDNHNTREQRFQNEKVTTIHYLFIIHNFTVNLNRLNMKIKYDGYVLQVIIILSMAKYVLIKLVQTGK